MRDASETPATPMMPHILRSVSHASRNSVGIYVSEPRNTLLHLAVSQGDADGTVARSHRAAPQRWDAQLAGQCLDGAGALWRTGNYSAAVGFAEENLVGREACSVRREIYNQTEARFRIGAAHGDLRERNTQPAVRTVVRGAEQPAPPLGAGDEQLDQTLLGVQVHAGRLATREIVTHLPVGRAAQLGACLAQDEHDVAGRTSVARHGAVRTGKQPDHPDDRSRIDGAGRALVVERDIAASHRRAERSAGVGDAAARLAELIENGGSLGIAEIETIGDAEWPGSRARDVAGGFRDGRLAALVRIEAHVAAVAVGLDRDAEVLVPHADHAGIATGRDHGARLDRRVVLLEDPLLAGD